jgi:hypothetical protein
MFKLARPTLSRRPSWKVYTKAGVMFRECARTHRLQYRDCATRRWIDVESHNALAWLIEDSQEIGADAPAWIRNQAEPEES